jgi:hypothetical protein
MSRKAIKVHRAELAMDAVLTPKALSAAQSTAQHVPEAALSPQQTANGENWRWWQDYGAGRHRQISVQSELSQ